MSQFIEMFGKMETTPIKEYILDTYPGEWGVEDSDGNGVRVIRTTNFTNTGKLNLADVVTRNIEEKKVCRKRIQKYDTILERSGGTNDNPVGRVVLFEEDDLFLCNNFTQVLRFKDVDPRFAFYALFYFYQTNRIAIRSMGSKTTGIQNLNMSKYLEIGVPNATTEQQNAFIQIAEQADKSKFVGFKSQFIEMFGNPNKGLWTASVADYCHILGGFAFKSDLFSNTGVPIVRISNINEGEVDIDQCVNYAYDFWVSNPSYRVLNGDILMAMSGATTGKVGVFKQNVPALLNQRVACIRQREGKSISSFLYAAFQSEYMYKVIQITAQGGAQPNISSKQIAQLPMPAANILDQKKFDNISQQADKSKYIS